MIKLNRVCVPLTLDCNLHCKYCYRDRERLDIPDFSDDMKAYLCQLSPDWCEAVIASGGEPLLHWDKVKELFSYVPHNVHKKIMSNCLLLTEDIVSYINDNEIELHFSHDGVQTSFLRGVDVLLIPQIRDLLKKVKYLRCFAVSTKFNVNVWENYLDTVKKLGRVDFSYKTFPMDDVSPLHASLVDGFDYTTWLRTWTEFRLSSCFYELPWYKGQTLKETNSSHGFYTAYNVLPNGVICGMNRICSVYGTIHTPSYDDLQKKALSTGILDYCKSHYCPYVESCEFPRKTTTAHVCRCRRMLMDFFHSDKPAQVRDYMSLHLLDVLKFYS